MAVAVDTPRIALDIIPEMQRQLDREAGDGTHFQIHSVSAYAVIQHLDSEFGREWLRPFDDFEQFYRESFFAEQVALHWQADSDDDVGDAEVLHQLRQLAPTVPALSSRVLSQWDRCNTATVLSGSAVSPSIRARMQGRRLSSFDRHSFRFSTVFNMHPVSGRQTNLLYAMPAYLPFSGKNPQKTKRIVSCFNRIQSHDQIVWANHGGDGHWVFWQTRVDAIDLCSRRTDPNSRPGKLRRTAFDQFLEGSDPPVVEERLPHHRKFNGTRHRADRRTWVAEMKPPKHKTKQDFGNFKSETEAARAVDAAFHHYGKPHLLNFPATSSRFLSTRPAAPEGLDQKAKVKYVKEEAKLLVADTSATALPTSFIHTTNTPFSLSTPELSVSTSPSCRPAGQFRSFSEISSPFRCTGPDDEDDGVSQPQEWLSLVDSFGDISSAEVQSNWETLVTKQISEQGGIWADQESPTLAAPPNARETIQSLVLDFLIQSPPPATHAVNESRTRFQDEID